MTNAEIVSEYEQWMRAWAAEKTVAARVRVAEVLLRECGGLEYLDARAIQRYLGRTRADGSDMKRWTRATYHGHLKSLSQFLLAAGYLDHDPMSGVPSPKRPRGKPKPLTEIDVQRVLAAATGDTRDWIVVALASGLRVSEIAALRGEDVTSDGIYVDGKGGLATTLPAHPDVLAIAARMPARGFWWPGSDRGHITAPYISKRVGQLFRSLGLEGSIHRCRHTYGTRLMRTPGVHVRTVQRLMRHESLETTANYSAVDEDELQQAVAFLPPSIVA